MRTMRYLIGLLASVSLTSLVSAQAAGELTKEFKTSFTSFAGSPEGNYGSGSLKIEATPNTWITLLGTTGRVGTSLAGGKTVHFGGRDLELGVGYKDVERHLVYGVGLSFPTTFVQSSPELTYGVFYVCKGGLSGGLTGFTGSSAVHAVELDEDLDLGNRWSLHSGASWVYSGNSTVSSNSGNDIRTLLVDSELIYAADKNVSLSVGLTNRLGDTTRFSLASPVGNHYGVVIACGVKF